MSRLAIPARDDVPEASKPILDAVHKQLGVVPNMFRLIAQSPAVLQGFTSNNGALTKTLDVKTRERIALAVAQVNGCDYCLSAHSYLGLNLAKISPEEVALNRKGESGDAKANAAVSFAAKVVRERGHITEADIATPASAMARSWRSSPSLPRTSLRICSTWSRRPTSTFRSSAPATRPDASEGWRLFPVVSPPP
jgi:uncharacterized peroxidase-related enzyme